jgi:RNA polymerase sigma-70 factor (ECF subfamily)
MKPPSESPALLLKLARGGESEALSSLLEKYRNYLRLLARTQIDRNLGVRLDPSDVVQETLMEAFRDFGQFAGSTERQLTNWLRKILVHNLVNQVRHHHAKRRDFDHQCSLEDQLNRSSMHIDQALAGALSSPSAQASRRERSVILADALARLPADYREVIIMRHLEERKFTEIAVEMRRSCGAVRMLWVRGLERLRGELEGLM